MFFNAITFKDSATPFAEALVELHHEIMFYLIVIVSVVIFILVNAINITRVRESYFYASSFSVVSFLKALFLNSIFLPVFNKFLYSSYYTKFYLFFTETLTKFIFLIASSGSSYLTYLLKTIILFKSLFLNFLNLFSNVEAFLSKIFGDFKALGYKNLFPNAFVSNNFFYKTRSSSSYLSYLNNIISYLSIVSLLSDLDYKHFFKNKEFLFSHFNNLSKITTFNLSSRSIANSLDLDSLENLYSNNDLPNLDELNPHFTVFFGSLLKNRFSIGNSLRIRGNSNLSYVSATSSRSIYAFLNAQTYTVHNTKLEII